jgi:UDP-N-acetylmuramoylalanine--D-glutamate ligase
MRILGKGKTALAIKEVFQEAELFDDSDKDIYDIYSDELTVVSPGIPPYNYLVQNTKNKESDYDLFVTKEKFSIWISGTNGKTTTTKMMDTLLKEEGFVCGGNIGTPLAQIKDNEKLILETSSFTLHYTNIAIPNIYVLLPISDDHLSWHGTFKKYEESKLKPLSMMGKDDIAIVPAKYKNYKTDAKLYTYNDSKDLAGQFDLEIEKIKFNEPFLIDSLLALCVQKLVMKKIDYKKINSFIVDKHKVEEFYDSNNRLWVDDSKATNVDAVIWALKGYKDRKISLILGGDDKGADLVPLFEELQKYDVEVFAIGTNSEKLFNLSKQFHVKCIKCFELKDAVKIISNHLTSNTKDVALLSPAAASLDQFNSYKDRGEIFKKLVFELN